MNVDPQISHWSALDNLLFKPFSVEYVRRPAGVKIQAIVTATAKVIKGDLCWAAAQVVSARVRLVSKRCL